MESQNPNQAQPTNPTRPRRKWLRRLAVPAALAVLALVYQLTRPPELVWWRSGRVGPKGMRIRILIPQGWIPDGGDVHAGRDEKEYWLDQTILFHQTDGRPKWLRSIFPIHSDPVSLIRLEIRAGQSYDATHLSFGYDSVRNYLDAHNPTITATRVVRLPKDMIEAELRYERRDARSFNRTYQQICDSLTIE